MRLAALTLAATTALTGVVAPTPAAAESGYDLWLRYPAIEESAALREYRVAIRGIVAEGSSPTIAAATAELARGLQGMLRTPVEVTDRLAGDHVLIIGTPVSSPIVAATGWTARLREQGSDGYVIRAAKVQGRDAIVVASMGEAGVLYGSFHLLRLVQTGTSLRSLDVVERPRTERRLLNHWDNLDGTVERGYAGLSLWWDAATSASPGTRISGSRIRDYARANASIGINGAVVNNVNANPRILTAEYLEKVAAIARALRPYCIRVYLSANAAAPKMLGDLATADPLDPAVSRWWRTRIDEIYRLIPDFGGFVVKANSEGQPGPQDYGRTHADGANVLADALAPHGGVVMWRAFVYDADVDPDRVKRAYIEFVPLDGAFRENVFVQVKNGPLDFQPREPFHPLFGAMPKTPLMAELQITQEYLGHSNHLVYLAPMWKEFLEADTYARGAGSTVAKAIDGSLHGKRMSGMAGVANTGLDVNWTGHHFGQANWYAFGRLAWNPDLGADAIADEWIRMTWGHAPDLVAAIRGMMLGSRETFVRYTMPLGLHHLIGGIHYAPMPENADPRRADWSAVYYHRASESGIGFDRTPSGSNAVSQYHPPLGQRWSDPHTTPDEWLLWFHRLPWDYQTNSGVTLWDALVRAYTRGASEATALEERWKSLRGQVDDERHQAVLAKLRRQADDASAWRAKCLRYFQAFSHRPLPKDIGEATLGSLLSPVLVGAAVNRQQSDGVDPVASTLVARHFNTMTAENLLKWENIHPAPDRYEFEPADRYVALAEANRAFIVGHTLVWHRQTPAWVFAPEGGGTLGRETLLARMRAHIHAVVGRYRGRVHGWDVVNEALEDDGTWRRTPWLTAIGEDYIARAFEYAQEADPDAELYYNDYNLWKPAKRAAALRIAGDLRSRGLRIDGVGEQGHWMIDSPSIAEIEQTIVDIGRAGFKPLITELDVDVLPRDPGLAGADLSRRATATAASDPYREGLPDERQQALATRYARIFGLFAKHRRVLARVTFWGVTDRSSWLNNFPIRGRTNHPLLWDRDGKPKPAFHAVIDVLRQQADAAPLR